MPTRRRCTGALVLGAVAAAVGVWRADLDVVADGTALLRGIAVAVAGVGPAVIAALLAVTVLHYTAAATATRAASGVALPPRQLVVAQVAASAANRVTPAGLGGAALIVRYLQRRGGMRAADATAAVSTLALLGGLADALALAGVVGVSELVHAPGAAAELPLLVGRLTGLVHVPGPALAIGAAVALLVAAGVGLAARSTVAARVGAVVEAIRRYVLTLASIVRHPGRLALLLGSSAITTVALAAGFAAAATLPSGGLPSSAFAALMVGYMIAAAAGAAVPLPGGIGAADAAFVAVLVTAGEPGPLAVAVVIVFRLITFWVPPAIGLLALRRLRLAKVV